MPKPIRVIDGIRKGHCSNCRNAVVKVYPVGERVVCEAGALNCHSYDGGIRLSQMCAPAYPVCFRLATKCPDYQDMGPIGLTLADELGF